MSGGMEGQSIDTKVDVLTVIVGELKEDVRQLIADNREQARLYVPTLVWQQRNESVDGKIQGLGREIGELRTELRSRRVSWPAVGALAVAAAALLLQLINALGRAGA